MVLYRKLFTGPGWGLHLGRRSVNQGRRD